MTGAGNVEGLTIRNNEFRGGNLLDASEGNIENVKIIDNKTYGGNNPITLGNAFGVEIAGNLFGMSVPQALVDDIKSAKTPEAKAYIVERIKLLFTDPAVWGPLIDLATKVWGN